MSPSNLKLVTGDRSASTSHLAAGNIQPTTKYSNAGISALSSSNIEHQINSVQDFQQAGGKVAFISLKRASHKEHPPLFDPEDAKLFKKKRFNNGNTSGGLQLADGNGASRQSYLHSVNSSPSPKNATGAAALNKTHNDLT